MQQIVSDVGLAQSQYYVVAIWYNTHAPPPPGSVCEAALFRDMAAKSLEEVGTTVREVSTPRTDWTASV